jgi:ABC-type nitrate/sulfonate/bicarbonate transport system substrate-binding protein
MTGFELRTKSLSFAFALALTALAFVGSAAAQDKLTLHYGRDTTNPKSLTKFPVEVALRKGFFAREGLDVVIEPVPADIATAEAFGSGHVPALEGRGIDMTRLIIPYLIEADIHGASVVGIAGETANPSYSLIARPEITTIADLKGKVIGMTAPADTITLTTRKLLAMHGLMAADFQAKRVRDNGPRLDCLRTGDCSAVPLGHPEDSIALKEGFRLLGTSNEVGYVVFDADVVRSEWAASHKDELVRYVRGLATAMRFIHDPKNRAEVTAIIKDITAASDEVARSYMDSYADPKKRALPRQAELDMEGITNVISLMGDAGVLPQPLPAASRFVDLTYLKAAGLQ